jgi:LPXTG-motif cell wall-anchored protein
MRGEATAALATGSDTTSPEQTAAASDQPAAEGQPTPDAVSTAPETAPPANLPVTGVEKAYTHWILLGLAFSLFALLLLYGAIAVDQVDP